jgi:hypothetical protein
MRMKKYADEHACENADEHVDESARHGHGWNKVKKYDSDEEVGRK